MLVRLAQGVEWPPGLGMHFLVIGDLNLFGYDIPRNHLGGGGWMVMEPLFSLQWKPDNEALGDKSSKIWPSFCQSAHGTPSYG